MAEPVALFPVYSHRMAPVAMAALGTLPAEVQVAAIQAMNLLAANPLVEPFTQKDPDNPEAYVYRQTEPPLEISYEIDNLRGELLFWRFDTRVVRSLPHLVMFGAAASQPTISEGRKFLVNVERRGLMTIWDPRDAGNGDRAVEARRQLDVADVVLFVVSQELLALDFESQTLTLDQMFDKDDDAPPRIVWVKEDHCVTRDTPFDAIRALNHHMEPLAALSDSDRSQTWVQVYEKIRLLLNNL